MTAKTSREFEQQLMEATKKLAETRERLVERERVASKLADDLNDNNKTIRKLKDELVAKSERQVSLNFFKLICEDDSVGTSKSFVWICMKDL